MIKGLLWRSYKYQRPSNTLCLRSVLCSKLSFGTRFFNPFLLWLVIATVRRDVLILIISSHSLYYNLSLQLIKFIRAFNCRGRILRVGEQKVGKYRPHSNNFSFISLRYRGKVVWCNIFSLALNRRPRVRYPAATELRAFLRHCSTMDSCHVFLTRSKIVSSAIMSSIHVNLDRSCLSYLAIRLSA